MTRGPKKNQNTLKMKSKTGGGGDMGDANESKKKKGIK